MKPTFLGENCSFCLNILALRMSFPQLLGGKEMDKEKKQKEKKSVNDVSFDPWVISFLLCSVSSRIIYLDSWLMYIAC